MKERNLRIGISTAAVGVLIYLLMFLTAIQRTTETAATKRIVSFNGFEFMNFDGIWALRAASIFQIVLMVFAFFAIVLGLLQIIESKMNLHFGMEKSCEIVLVSLATIGIVLMTFAIIYCKLTNYEEKGAYIIKYIVGTGPFLQTALCILTYAYCDYISRLEEDEGATQLEMQEVAILSESATTKKANVVAEEIAKKVSPLEVEATSKNDNQISIEDITIKEVKDKQTSSVNKAKTSKQTKTTTGTSEKNKKTSVTTSKKSSSKAKTNVNKK